VTANNQGGRNDVPDQGKKNQGGAGPQGSSGYSYARFASGEGSGQGLKWLSQYLWSPGGLSVQIEGEPKQARIDDPVDADRAPDLIEPVLAWRGWEVSMSGHLTGSAAGSGYVFDPGPNKAVCKHEGHTDDVPAVGCGCGFYGWHEPGDIAHGEIRGAIKCWGEIIVHDVGIRAEYAEIVCLFQPTANERRVELAAKRYGVPIVKSQDEAEALAGVEGIRVPKEMRPKQAKLNDSVSINLSVSLPNWSKLLKELESGYLWSTSTAPVGGEEEEDPTSFPPKKDSAFGRQGPGHERRRRLGR
jgi:hypothetical protein